MITKSQILTPSEWMEQNNNATSISELMEKYAKYVAIRFLDSARAYERESDTSIGNDERESEEFYLIFTGQKEAE